MNIFEKINQLKLNILNNKDIKKSGKNKFSGFSYFELADITPTIIKECDKLKLFTQTSFIGDKALLKIINIEKPEEYVEYESPIIDYKSFKNDKTTNEIIEDLTSMNSIQRLGATQTYIRRYLFLMAFDIIENDTFDAVSGSNDNKQEIKKQVNYRTYYLNMLYKKYNGTTEIDKIQEELNKYDNANSFEQSKLYTALKNELNKGGK